jgi:hypothetical protein
MIYFGSYDHELKKLVADNPCWPEPGIKKSANIYDFKSYAFRV